MLSYEEKQKRFVKELGKKTDEASAELVMSQALDNTLNTSETKARRSKAEAREKEFVGRLREDKRTSKGKFYSLNKY